MIHVSKHDFAVLVIVVVALINLSFAPTVNEGSVHTISAMTLTLFFMAYTWLIKQNRTKVTEHNYFYKKRVLTTVKDTLEVAIKFNRQLVETIKSEKPYTETPTKYRKSLRRCHSQLDIFIDAAKSDTYVPFDIRDEIDSLLWQIRKTITHVLEESQAPYIILDKTLLIHQKKIFDLEYFTEDGNKKIQELLHELKDTWFKIELLQSKPQAWDYSPQWMDLQCCLHNLKIQINGNSGSYY